MTAIKPPAFNLFATYKLSEDKETAGVWVYPMGEFKDAPAFLLARAGGANKGFNDAQAAGLRPYAPMINKGARKLAPEVLSLIKEVNFDCFLKHCLKGWKNVKNETQTEELAFTEENAKELFTALPALYEELLGDAHNTSNYTPDSGTDVKN